MLTVHITDDTKPAMLRAIRAACNELLGETVELRLPTAAVESLQAFADQEQAALATAFDKAVETAGAPVVAAALVAEQTEELDSAGQPWSAELHASTKSKNADGTWKKRRGAAQAATETVAQDDAATLVPTQSAPPVPPAPTPTTPAEPIMPKIFALITSQIVTINQAVEAAQAEGYADLGANGLGGAPAEKQLAVLRKLEG